MNLKQYISLGLLLIIGNAKAAESLPPTDPCSVGLAESLLTSSLLSEEERQEIVHILVKARPRRTIEEDIDQLSFALIRRPTLVPWRPVDQLVALIGRQRGEEALRAASSSILQAPYNEVGHRLRISKLAEKLRLQQLITYPDQLSAVKVLDLCLDQAKQHGLSTLADAEVTTDKTLSGHLHWFKENEFMGHEITYIDNNLTLLDRAVHAHNIPAIHVLLKYALINNVARGTKSGFYYYPLKSALDLWHHYDCRQSPNDNNSTTIMRTIVLLLVEHGAHINHNLPDNPNLRPLNCQLTGWLKEIQEPNKSKE